MTRSRRWSWVAVLGALALALTACPEDEVAVDDPDDGAEAEGTIAQEVDLSGAQFTVGSKEFTEQLILGHITQQALEAAGADVEFRSLVGTPTVRAALEEGEIDMYWEYTGTGWLEILGHDDYIPDEREQYEAVRDEDAESDIVWLEPAGFNNTYAIATYPGGTGEHGATTISEWARLIEEDPSQGELCAAAEFLVRDDGLPGLEETYGFDLPEDNVNEMELGVVYSRLEQGDPCQFGEVFATDGRIEALGLEVLEDDEAFFPTYLPALTVRSEVSEEWPQLEQLSALLAERLDTDTMRDLNARVDVDGELEEAVAEEWLREEGLID